MVEVKREDITLQDWTKGISADEYAWGSYYYSEGISSGYNTKGFELWPQLSKTALNYRDNWYAVALAPTREYGIMAFTKDWMIETEEFYNWADWDGDTEWGGALFSRYGWWYDYVNGALYWSKALGIAERYIDVLDIESPYDPADELLTNTTFSSNWTIGTGWTIEDWVAVHTTGETWTLEATINFAVTPTTSDYVRVAVKITDRTAWHLEVWLDHPSTSYSSTKDGWMTFCFKCSATTTGLVITPSSTFNWKIEKVNVHLYTGLEVQKGTLYNWSRGQPHPAVVWEWDLYVACGNYVNIFSLVDRGRTYKQLVDKNFTIVSMTQQAWSLILRATDWFDSRQYYWNWVDAVAYEVIEWKWLIIKWVTGSETISYVLTTSGSNVGAIEGYEYRLYAVSGYQRNLIASKLYQYMSRNYLQQNPYNINKKFDFNDVENDQSMVMYLDSLYIPGCDGIYKYGTDVPWLRTAWTRPIKYDTGATNITLWQRNAFLNVWFRVGTTNYIGKIDPRLYTSTGYIITESIYRDKLSSRKSLEKLKLWFKSVASTVGNIKFYVIVDDDYFWRFWPTATPTNRPEIGAVYNIAHDTKGEVIDVDKTNGVITFKTLENKGSYIGLANTTITKVSGAGDDSIAVGHKFDNMCLVKTIETTGQEYGSELIFGKDFVNNYLPYRYKIQFVIELNSNNKQLSPEIYELSMISDINDVVL